MTMNKFKINSLCNTTIIRKHSRKAFDAIKEAKIKELAAVGFEPTPS